MPTIIVAESSSVRVVEYEPSDDTTGELFVTFANMRRYRYSCVPVSVFERLVAANEIKESVGSLVRSAVVKGGFECEEVTGG